MAVLPTFALLLVFLLPLVVTATFTVDPTYHAAFKRNNRTDHELPHGIPEGGPGFINDDGINRLDNEMQLNLIGPGMPDCLAGACDVSEIYIWPGRDIHRRSVSYESLKKNFVPCNLRGKSYYNCQLGSQVNPYRRRCISITQCARIMD